MKKNVVLIISIIVVVLIIALVYPSGNTESQELIRIHIRANSNLDDDQNVKYLVRDSVIDYLVPYLSECKDRNDAYKVLDAHNANIKKTADSALKKNGYNYVSTVNLVNEYFPVRQYEDLLVESGYYDALIIELGEGAGNNWWCVVYPPLCFVNSSGQGNVKYKSKLVELINKYFR